MKATPAPRARRHQRVLLFVLLSTVVSSLSYAQLDTKAPPMNGIAHVAIRVHNLATSTAFYEKLGFEQAFDLSKDGVAYESFIMINDTQFIELYPATEHDPAIGFLHLCFEGA